MNILILAAHPDDEILGMGGTIKKFTKSKNNVKIVIFATGIAARRSTNYKNSTSYKIDKQTNQKINQQIISLRKDAKNDMAKTRKMMTIPYRKTTPNAFKTLSKNISDFEHIWAPV